MRYEELMNEDEGERKLSERMREKWRGEASYLFWYKLGPGWADEVAALETRAEEAERLAAKRLRIASETVDGLFEERHLLRKRVEELEALLRDHDCRHPALLSTEPSPVGEEGTG